MKTRKVNRKVALKDMITTDYNPHKHTLTQGQKYTWALLFLENYQFPLS